MNTQSHVSVWLAILTRPRSAIRRIVETHSPGSILVLMMFAGVFDILNLMLLFRINSAYRFFLLIFTGAVGGIVGLYIATGLLKWIGDLLDGRASTAEVRAAIGWSSVPLLLGFILLLPELSLYTIKMVTGNIPAFASKEQVTGMLFIFRIARIAAIIWAYIVLLKCISEINGFSVLRAFIASLLSGFIFILPLILIANIAVLLRLFLL